MEQSEILSAVGELKLYLTKAALDEIVATAVNQHEPSPDLGSFTCLQPPWTGSPLRRSPGPLRR